MIEWEKYSDWNKWYTEKYVKGLYKDDVNKPEHYTLPRAATDCFSVMKQLGMLENYPLATAFKYLWRCNNKDNYLKDLKKCRWFIDKAIEIYEAKLEAEKSNKDPRTNTKY